MIGYTLQFKTYTTADIVPQPAKILHYNFKNNGSTIAIIEPADISPGENVAMLEPGEALDTRLINGRDLTKYRIRFKSINDQDAESQISELLVTTFIAV